MNSLGRGWRSCAVALQNYHRDVRRLRQRTRDEADLSRLRAQLQQLLFDLEVDVAARAGPAGRSRMTEVEQQLLYPTLVMVRSTLEGIPMTDRAATWQRPLGLALAALRAAVPQLRRWRAGRLSVALEG